MCVDVNARSGSRSFEPCHSAGALAIFNRFDHWKPRQTQRSLNATSMGAVTGVGDPLSASVSN